MAEEVVLAAVRLTRTLRALNQGGPLPGPQAGALVVIVYAGRIVARDLARFQEVTPATMSRLLAVLEGKGLIRREADAEDSRLQWISATSEGVRLVREGQERRMGPLTRAVARLSPEQRAEVAAAVAIVEKLTARAAEEAQDTPTG